MRSNCLRYAVPVPHKILVSCASLLGMEIQRELPQYMLCINRLQPVAGLTVKHCNEVRSRSEIDVWNVVWEDGKNKGRKNENNTGCNTK